MAKTPQYDPEYAEYARQMQAQYSPELKDWKPEYATAQYDGELKDLQSGNDSTVLGVPMLPGSQQPAAQPPQPQGIGIGQGLSNLTGAVGQGLSQGVQTAINPQTWIGLGQDLARQGAKQTASTLMSNPVDSTMSNLNAANVGLNQFTQNATNTLYNLPGQIGAAYQGTQPKNTNLWAMSPEEMAMQTYVGPDNPLRGMINDVVFAPDQATQQAALQRMRSSPEYGLEMRKFGNSYTEAPLTQTVAANPDMLIGAEGLARGAATQIGKRTVADVIGSGARTAALEGAANILSSDNQNLQDVVQQGAIGGVAGGGSELVGMGLRRAADTGANLIKQAMPVQQLEGGMNPTFSTGVVGERAEAVTPQAIQDARQATPQQSLNDIYPQQDPLGMGRVQRTQGQTPDVQVSGQYNPQPRSIYNGADPRMMPSEATMAGNIQNMAQRMDTMANDYFANNAGSAAQPTNVFQQYLKQANGDVNAATSMAANDMLERMPPEQRATISVEDWQRQVNQFAEQLRQQQLSELTSYPTNYAQSPTAGADFVGRVDQQAIDAQRAQQQQLLNYPTNYAQSPTAGADFVGRVDQQAIDAQRAQQQQLLNYPTNYAQSPTAGADTVARYDTQNAPQPAPPQPNPMEYQAAGITNAVQTALQQYEAELQRLNAAAQNARAALTPPSTKPLTGKVTKESAGQALKKGKAPAKRGKRKAPQ